MVTDGGPYLGISPMRWIISSKVSCCPWGTVSLVAIGNLATVFPPVVVKFQVWSEIRLPASLTEQGAFRAYTGSRGSVLSATRSVSKALTAKENRA